MRSGSPRPDSRHSPLTTVTGATARASRGGGSRFGGNSRIGEPRWHVRAGPRGLTQTESPSGACQLGGGHALLTAASDPRIAGVVALVPLADGLPLTLEPAPPAVVLRMIGRAAREATTRRPVPVPVAGPPGSLAATVAREALPGFTRLAAGNGWHNEISSSGLFAVARYRPVRQAHRIATPVLLQLGERDAMVPPAPIEKTAARVPRGELLRYPIDHFQCFWPEYLDHVATDQIAFLSNHLLAQQPRSSSKSTFKSPPQDHQ
jgi:hypothetical protein